MRNSPRRFTLSAAQRLSMYGTTALLWLTGLAWLAGKYLLSGEAEGAQHPVVPWSMKLHGALIWVFAVLAGSVWAVHMRAAWRAQVNRTAGLAMGGLSVFLAVTGYLLYYGAGAALHDITSVLHWVCGLLLLPLLALHVWWGRKRLY